MDKSELLKLAEERVQQVREPTACYPLYSGGQPITQYPSVSTLLLCEAIEALLSALVKEDS